MKKLLALLAVVLAVVSCQKEINGLPVDSNNEAAVSFSVALPDDATRAAGTDSAKGGVSNVDMTQYDIRFILEVYDENGVLAKERMVNCTDAPETSFQLRLVPGRAYNFVVWADFVLEDSQADLYYNTNVNNGGLRNVQVIDDNWDAIIEARDAYTDVFTVHNFSSTSTIDMTLTRPFAKLRVVTNDIDEMISIRPAEVKVKYFNTKFYTTFDAFAEIASGVREDKELTVTLLDAQKNGVDTYIGGMDAQKGVQTLFADYFFGAEDDRVMFTFDVKDNGGRDLPQVTFNTNIPVKRNNLTTVYGPILTDANNVTVTINPAFENGTEWNPEKDQYDVEVITGTKTETVTLTTGKYLFDDVTIKVADGNAIEVNGDVVIDVMGVMNLESKGGIVVNNGSLVINGVVKTRGAEPARAGILKVVTEEGSAIGGNDITIQNLAGLTAKANGNHAFGIGAADATVVIKNTKIDYVAGGHVQATLADDDTWGKKAPEGGAAIGGANVTIENSEIVKAEGGSKAAAIGNKYWASTNIVIKNSTLGDIFGGNASAAIGGSRYNKENKQSINIAIEGSTIANAVGGTYGAGIGSGYDTYCATNDSNAVNKIEISTSTITAKGGKYAAGIGTGHHAAALRGSIDAASKINATSGDESYCDESGYVRLNTVAQGIGYGSVDANCEFKDVVVTFTVADKVIEAPYILVKDASLLAKALMADLKNIPVVLNEDIDLPISSLGTITGGSGEYKLGGEATENITIDLNGKRLNITTTYWSAIGAKNNDALFTIKNGRMTSTGNSAGTWNAWDLRLSNCNYAIEDVIFEKAVALDNVGKSTSMKNVTITDNHDTDTYGLWITAEGQTVTLDGCVIDMTPASDGRGIKIDNQYVAAGTEKKVTLNVANTTFKTDEKAAILVKNPAGADITLSNIDIAGVAEDTSNEVWVDEDYAEFVNKVNVVGGSMIVEGNTILADGVVLKKDGVYYISNKAGMFWFANEVNVNKNAFNDKIVKLANDIDLQNTAWTPVGQTGVATFNGVFDGQNYTISNLNVNSEAQTGENYSSGLFGWVESHTAGHGHIKNVKINGATINGHHNCGALVGYITQETALVENCHVTGATVTCTKANNDADGDKAGALIGNATVATPVKNCTAANSTVSAGRDAGQVIGAGKEANVTGCSATNVAVSANDTGTGANVRNEVIGRLL